MLEARILCHLNSLGTGKQTPEDSRFWPSSNFDEGQLLLTLKARTGPKQASTVLIQPASKRSLD
jgi:hypothetical protein